MPAKTNLRCANCGAPMESFPHYCAVNWSARLAGQEDRQKHRKPIHADEWPNGTYGSADYWLGYYTDTK